ncbi:hypothetical protein GDO78_009239 [Eleutherodactylus coqui]|uniref:Uncharacterized protein n=1 Tax=Eleutherodactylus coqui TaxID=57060 RepID=A0A8J6K722_ELECQ|nr:hypothetical protein GDO78_009239 [Eleutherodactylus coqui]
MSDYIVPNMSSKCVVMRYYDKIRYTFTRVPQGCCESPTIVSQAMSVHLAQFQPLRGSQRLLHVGSQQQTVVIIVGGTQSHS